jgi:pimeloyl-ACP methyl ester carboxylesterase
MSDNGHQDGIHPFPAGMESREIETNGAKIHVRVGGHGPAVVMLHGFGTTGDMWGHLASALVEDHTVVVPDLHGLGLSSKPAGGYDKKNQAADVVGVLDALGVRTAELVTHDIGIMLGFAVAATHPERVSRWVAIDAPLPGVGPWRQITQDPAMWHFGFGGHDMERLLAGRDRFSNELSGTRAGSMKRSAGTMPRSMRNPARCERALPCPVPGVQPGRGRQQDVPCEGQASDAGLGLRWRSDVRPDDRRGAAVCRR